MQKLSIEKAVEIIEKCQEEHEYLKKLPVEIVLAFIKVESNFNILAVRPEPNIKDVSIGLMQLLTKTAEWIDNLYKLGKYKGFYSLFDASNNICLGMHFLYWTYRACKYNMNCTIQAYNEGIGNYRKGKRVEQYQDKILKAIDEIIKELNNE